MPLVFEGIFEGLSVVVFPLTIAPSLAIGGPIEPISASVVRLIME